MFVSGVDKGYFYLDGINRPLMGYFVVPLILLGIIYTLLNYKKKESLIMLTWIFLCLFFNSWLTKFSNHSQRTLIILPALIIMAVSGMRFLTKIFSSKKMLGLFIIVLFVLFIAGEELVFYFADYTKNQRFYGNGDLYGQTFTYLGRYLLRQPLEIYQLYFLKEDNVYFAAIPSLMFMTQKDGKDISDLKELDNIKGDNILLLGGKERMKEGESLTGLYPKGGFVGINNKSGKLVAWVYYLKR